MHLVDHNKPLSIVKRKQTVQFIGSLFVLVVIGLIYFPMVAPSVAPQGDSGELVTVSYFWGVAHPPGYPLFSLLGHLFSKIPWGEVAWRINLMSMVFHLASLYLVLAIVKKLTFNWQAAIVATLILAFSANFWLYSLVAEVFSLNNLIALAIIYLSFDITKNRLILIAFLFGLGLSNHLTIVFLLLPIAILISGKKFGFKTMVTALAAGILGLFPYLLIYIRAKLEIISPTSWIYPNSLEAIIHLFLRSDYGTFAPTSNSDPSLAKISDKIDHVVTYFRFFIDDFGFVGIILVILGAIRGWIYNKKITLALLSGFLISGIFFLSYANFPYKEFSGTGLEILERFYLLPNLFLIIFIGIGLSAIFVFARRIFVLRLLYIPLAGFYIFNLFFNHYQLVNQSGNYLASNFGKNFLSGAAKNSLIVLQGDVPTFVSFYQRYVLGYRSDLEFLTPNQVIKYNQYRYLKSVRPNLDFSQPAAASPEGILENNLGKVKIYSVGPPSFGLTNYLSSPSGLLFEILSPEEISDFSSWKDKAIKITENYILPDFSRHGNITLADQTIYYYYDRMYTSLGDFCRFNNQLECAQNYYQLAISIDSRDLVAIYGLGQTLQKKGECSLAQNQYEKFLEYTNGSQRGYMYLADLAKNCFKDKVKTTQYEQRLKNNNLRNL